MENCIKLLREDEVFDSISPDIYLDIYELNNYIDNDPKFSALDSGRDFRNIKVPEFDHMTFLIKRISLKFSEILALTSRRTGYLIFKFGLAHLEMDLHDSIKKKKLFKYIIKCGSIRGDIRFNLEGVTGRGRGGFRIFLSIEQRDKVKEIKEILGCKSEGTVVFMCIIYAANSTFRNLDKNTINEILRAEEGEEVELSLALERYYNDSGFLRDIMEYITLYENRLSGFIKKAYLHFKKLERYNEKRKIQKSPCMSKIIQLIEDEGWN